MQPSPLFDACFTKNEKKLKEHLSQGSVKFLDYSQWNCLHACCSSGFVKGAVSLIEMSCDVNAVTVEGWTPLFIACQYGHKELVEYLLQLPGIDIDKVGADGGTGWTPLMIACMKKRADIVELLVAARANPRIASHSGDSAADVCRGDAHLLQLLTAGSSGAAHCAQDGADSRGAQTASWTVRQVQAHFDRLGASASCLQKLAEEQIDGEALLGLTKAELRSDLAVSLGVATKHFKFLEENSKVV